MTNPDFENYVEPAPSKAIQYLAGRQDEVMLARKCLFLAMDNRRFQLTHQDIRVVICAQDIEIQRLRDALSLAQMQLEELRGR